MTRTRLLMFALLMVWFGGSAAAASQGASHLSRVNAIVERFQGQSLTVRTAEGKELPLALSPKVLVLRSKPASVADVKSGEFIGCTAVEDENGKLDAKEIHILPESMRGVGEGHYPWGTGPKTTMTNGNIEQVAGVANGHAITVDYKGGQSEIQIPPDVPVTRIEVVNRDLLKPGARVTVFAQKNADGSLNPQFISILPETHHD
jgi:hypothetical protein